jgi:release factor glutamine methyltransferase
MKISAKEIYHKIKSDLSEKYPHQEAESISYLLMEDLLGLKKIDVVVDKITNQEDEVIKRMNNAIQRLKKYEPLQYILGKTEFYGFTLQVGPGVLIPRPETEELVDLIIKRHSNYDSELKILDICTGSGCIPIALKKHLPIAEIYALDISPEALSLAKKNALQNQVEINFYESDVLKDNLLIRDLNIIVSNPPYVKLSEKSLMKENVLNYEPHLALFVEDHDPLIFYRQIIKEAQIALKPGGKIYFEINEALGEQVKQLLEKYNFNQILIHQDLQGKSRIVEASN